MLRTMNRMGLMLSTIAALSLALVPAGCGGDNELTLPPQIEVTVDGHPTKKSFKFASDSTGGQLTKVAPILILNSGEGELELKEIKFTTTNPFLKLIYAKGKPSFPVTLASNERIQLQVRFAPDPNIVNLDPASLVIKHNDDNESDVTINFTIESTGPTVELGQTSYTYVNPSSANPPTPCFTFTNKGNEPLIFKKAYMETATKFYTITETPNENSTIGASGQGDNPRANPKKLQVCVRLTPGDKSDDYSAKLVIETNDAKNRYAKVNLNAKWEEDNVFKVTCGTPDGSLKYDFSGTKSGIVEKCCNIYNEGPSGLLVNKVEVAAVDTTKQELADKIFGYKLYKTNANTGDDEKVTLPRSISPSKSLKFCVEYIYPVDNKSTNGELVINYSQANVAASLQLPVIAGSCDTPDLLVGPGNSPLWLQTSVGKNATKTLSLVNQSCAPLQILQVCTTQVASTGAGKNPCDNATLQSAHFGLVKEIGLSSVKPWDILPIDVKFAPPNAKYNPVNHFLNIVYCPGEWASDKCSDPVVARTVNLTGVVEAEESKLTKLPTLSLAPYNGQKPVVGQPFKIEAAPKEGDWPIGQYGAYLWVVAKRPVGSNLWISNDFQTTDEGFLTINPDKKGSYTIVGQVQAVDDADQTKLAWSEQVSFTFEVKE
ncbi:MAG: hypothetical protein KC502_13340 [Myxococcales bacterium]|nr:hypothetical protein [Myxococcales bacterium]